MCKISNNTFQLFVWSFLFLFLPATVNANISSEHDRKLYQQAQDALKKNRITQFKQIEKQLVQYPLYPYLRYEYLKRRINNASDEEIQHFFNRFSDLPVAPDLRKRWLKRMAKQKNWGLLLENYQPQKENSITCLYLQAKSFEGLTDQLLLDIRDLWLAGKSLPNECDPLFDILYNSHYMNDELIWQRIRLSMEQKNIGLASYLSKKLKPQLKDKFNTWRKAHGNPGSVLAKTSLEDNQYNREIVLYAIKRLSRRQLTNAIQHWSKWKQLLEFTDEEKALLNREIALRAFDKEHPDALYLLDKVPNEFLNKSLFVSRLKIALQQQQWEKLLQWLDGVPPDDESIKHPWYYWKARALQKTGFPYEAEKVFSEIVNERDYYGFLAADYLDKVYGINHSPIKSTKSLRKELYEFPAVLRIKEFLELGQQHLAIREWQWMIRDLDKDQLEQAALLASDWKWNDRVIVTLGHAKLYDDLILRFPLGYEKEIQWYSNKYQLDLSWVFALVRAESAFIETARSPAGALGLMQVMPATGKMTAKRLGWKKFSTNMLLQANKNIPIGSAYLKQMLERFGGNLILATAAYNAGPHRVTQWLPKISCMEPDVWVEQIPFKETRQYVKRILYYANIYDWRIEQKLIPIRDRMDLISPRDNNGIVSSNSCKAEIASLN